MIAKLRKDFCFFCFFKKKQKNQPLNTNMPVFLFAKKAGCNQSCLRKWGAVLLKKFKTNEYQVPLIWHAFVFFQTLFFFFITHPVGFVCRYFFFSTHASMIQHTYSPFFCCCFFMAQFVYYFHSNWYAKLRNCVVKKTKGTPQIQTQPKKPSNESKPKHTQTQRKRLTKNTHTHTHTHTHTQWNTHNRER